MVLVLAAVGVLAFTGVLSYGFAETYGSSERLLGAALLGGLLIGPLLVVARAVARLARPSTGVVLLAAVVVTAAVYVVSGTAGARSRETGLRSAAAACVDPVGVDLVTLARAAGRAAGGDGLPNDGVGLFDGEMTMGTTSGLCVAGVNATIEHVLEAAASLGWEVPGSGVVVSPTGVTVRMVAEPEEPDTHPLVWLEAHRRSTRLERGA